MKSAFILFSLYSLTLSANLNSADLYNNYEKSINAKYSHYEFIILQKWQEFATSSKKIFVGYYQDYDVRLIVDYELGTIRIEGLNKNLSAMKFILDSIVSEKESPDALVNFKDVLESGYKSKKQFIGELINNAEFENKYNKTKINFNFAKDHIKKRAARVKPLVLTWAKKSKVDFALTMAVIRQESAFNPMAESNVPAIGLMQIVPKYAGRDVNIAVIGVDKIPTKNDLFDSETNIVYGTSYLRLLKNKFNNLSNDKDKIETLMIASYNWGQQKILNALKNKKINLDKDNIQEQINKIAPKETIDYLEKVKGFKKDFQIME